MNIKEILGKNLCKLGFHKYYLRHPFTHYGIIYGKLGFSCSRCGKEKTRAAGFLDCFRQCGALKKWR